MGIRSNAQKEERKNRHNLYLGLHDLSKCSFDELQGFVFNETAASNLHESIPIKKDETCQEGSIQLLAPPDPAPNLNFLTVIKPHFLNCRGVEKRHSSRTTPRQTTTF